MFYSKTANIGPLNDHTGFRRLERHVDRWWMTRRCFLVIFFMKVGPEPIWLVMLFIVKNWVVSILRFLHRNRSTKTRIMVRLLYLHYHHPSRFTLRACQKCAKSSCSTFSQLRNESLEIYKLLQRLVAMAWGVKTERFFKNWCRIWIQDCNDLYLWT